MIEVISHCFGVRYAALLVYHFSSLVLRESKPITMTVIYIIDDKPTITVLEYFSKLNVPWIRWNFIPMVSKLVYQRPIGRNIAAKQSTADIVWFADCDYVFGDGCLDTLWALHPLKNDAVFWPEGILYCTNLSCWKEIVSITRKGDEVIPKIVDVNPLQFTLTIMKRAIGGVQIVSGDTARKYGYLPDDAIWQRPIQKYDHDDGTAFWREQFDSLSKLTLPNVYRI